MSEQIFEWGVSVAGPQFSNQWGIATEIDDPLSTMMVRRFRIGKDQRVERYWLTDCRAFGANKVQAAPGGPAAIQFACRAPHAQAVALVTADPSAGYLLHDSDALTRHRMVSGADGIWRTDPGDAAFADFAVWDHVPYMYSITRADGSKCLRTDLFSRCQIGRGRKDPERPLPGEAPWNGTRQDVKGTKSCSVVIDPERVTELLEEGRFPETQWLDAEAFWEHEFDHLRPVPTRVEELVIYELHVEGLGFGMPVGTFADAIDHLDRLVELGINAVELLPAMEAESYSWGYGTSHHFAAEYAGGGRDQFKHFVRACHQRGIAVILDVVYNHWVHDAERSEDLFDSTREDENFHYWYEGRDEEWPPDPWNRRSGGYLDNGSTGWLPNLRDASVRRMFTSSAAMWLAEFHVDGFRVDLTQALHRDNHRHGDRQPVPDANRYGAKFMREWVRTLRLIKPSVMLFAEDHSGWPAITQPQETGGIGFDAIWWVDWYHNLIGDSQPSTYNARLLHVAGAGGDGPLPMTTLAALLAETKRRVIYHESHDQAGNARYEEDGAPRASARTIRVAVKDWLDDTTRSWAEARVRAVAGLTLVTPGIPMFFMGEEVGAQEPYRYEDWIDHREDLAMMRQGSGARLFAFYQDVIALRHASPALRGADLAIVHSHDANRVLAYRSWLGSDEFLVVFCLANRAFADGYVLAHGGLGDGPWIEMLGSDDARYGGSGLRNPGLLRSTGGQIAPRVPANSLTVLRRA